jgi:hypothetical protein
MQIKHKENEKSLNSPKIIWKNILKVTEKVGADEAKALRILFYMLFSSGSKPTIRYRFRFYRRIWSLLKTNTDGQIPDRPKNSPLFAFIFNTPSNMNNILPVFLEAQRRGLNSNIIFGDGVIVDSKHLQALTSITKYHDIISLTLVKERVAGFRRAREQYEALLNGFESVSSELAATIRKLKLELLMELTLLTVIRIGLNRFYYAIKPSCVVSTSDLWPFEHVLFAEARSIGIPSFIIQHGVIADPFWWPFVADKLLLWGDPFKNEILKIGAPANRLVVSGFPATDSIFSKYAGKSTFFQNKSASSYTILSNTQDRVLFPDLFIKYKSFLKSLVSETPSIQWNVKLHPNEDERFYRDILDGPFINFKILPKSTSLEESVSNADVTCTLYSTAGLEAMVMQKPLVVFDIDPKIQEISWWPNSGGGIYIKSVEDMVEFVNKSALNCNLLSELLLKQNDFMSITFANQGRAGEAILDEIEETLTNAASRKAL